MGLQLSGVSKSYGQIPVLIDIHLQVKKGEICAIIGKSGSGKSTLLNLISTLDQADGGSIIFNKKNITQMNELQREKFRAHTIGYVYQNHHLLPELTVLENTTMPSFIRGMSFTEAMERSKNLLNEVGLYKRRYHYPKQLSGGEKSRLSLVTALTANKALILADEPTGNLDEVNANRVFQLLIRLQKQNKFCLVIVTHNYRLLTQVKHIYSLESGILKLIKKKA